MTRRAVLCLNLGSPDAPKVAPIRRYLKNFLDDRRVLTLPLPFRKLLLWGIILPLRPYKVKKAYEAIWDSKTGSPLIHYSQLFADKLNSAFDSDTQVYIGMRHGRPNWQVAIDKILYSNPDEIVLFSQFPQYASATTGSLVEAIYQYISTKTVVPSIRLISDFYDHHAFIRAQAKQISPYVNETTELVLSYHGLPVKDVVAVDGKNFPCDHKAPCPVIGPTNRYCYRAQCYETSRQLIQMLGISPDRVHTTFQSRLGKIPWIQPYTDLYLKQLREQGKTEVVIACPAFTADCLETLEEVGIGLKEQWLESGGTKFTLVPCLNDSDEWVKAAKEIILQTQPSSA